MNGAIMIGVDRCVFWEILADRLPASVILRDGRCMAFMDIQPVNAGHVLVVPEDHVARLADLPEETGVHIFRTAQKIAAALSESGLEPFPKRLAPWEPGHQATGFRIRGAARQIELRPVSNREAHPFRETL